MKLQEEVNTSTYSLDNKLGVRKKPGIVEAMHAVRSNSRKESSNASIRHRLDGPNRKEFHLGAVGASTG